MQESVSPILTGIKGVCEFYINGKFESRHNLVVSNCRRILRDLVYGARVVENDDNSTKEEFPNPPTIEYLVLGDMGLTLAEAQAGVTEASVDDKTLVNPQIWVPVKDETNYPNNKKEAVVYQGNKAIQYTFVLAKDQGNAAGFFCELGLAINNTTNPNDYLFTKMNRLPIIKTSSDELTLVYYLIF